MKRLKDIALVILTIQTIIMFYLISFLISNNYLEITIILFIISLISFLLLLVSYFNIKKVDSKADWYTKKLDDAQTIVFKTRKNTEFLINDLPIGIVNFDDDFIIKWANENFKSYVQHRNCEDSNLKDVANALYEHAQNGEKDFQITLFDKHFDCLYNPNFNSISIEDQTGYYNYKTKYNNRRLAIGLLKFDDYGELMTNLDVQERTEIQGKYQALIADYARNFRVDIKTVSDETFLLIMDQNQLRQMIDDKFSILKAVREEENNMNLRLTASIGVSSYDIPYDDLQVKTNEAISLAERRGGDQAIVDIEGEEIMYIGGTVEASEKKSKVRSRIVSGKVLNLIDEVKQIFIVGHSQADADAIGSLIGISVLVKSRDKNPYCIVEYDNIDKTAKKIYDYCSEEDKKNFISAETAKKVFKPNESSLVFVLDCNSENQVAIKDFVNNCQYKVIIDHHRRNANTYENVDVQYIEAYASSTAELVTELIMFAKPSVHISIEEAVCLYCGIVVDTNNFTSKTGARTFEAAAFLRMNGSDNKYVKALLRDSEAEIREVNELVNKFKLYKDKYAFVMDDHVHANVTLAKVSNKLLDIDGVEASFTIAKLSDDVYGISARSIGNVNVQTIMEHLGGGGHLTGAASQLTAANALEIYDMIINYINSKE